MPGADYYVRQGDSPARLTATLLDANGDAVDLTGADIQIQLLPIGAASYLVDTTAENMQNGDGSDGTLGDVAYDLEATDEDGLVWGTWVVTFANSAVQSYPNGGFFLLNIFKDVPGTTPVLATTSQLEARLGIEFTADEHVRAQRLLCMATAEIQRESKQTISLVEGDVLTIRGTNASRFRLPQRPVGAVTSVSVDGVVLDPDSYYLSGDELVRATWGHSFGSPLFGYPTQELVVTYDHGYAADEVPGEVVAICLEVAARVWVNPGAVVSESIGSVQTNYSTSPVSGLLLTADERLTLSRVLGRSLGQVQLR